MLATLPSQQPALKPAAPAPPAPAAAAGAARGLARHESTYKKGFDRGTRNSRWLLTAGMSTEIKCTKLFDLLLLRLDCASCTPTASNFTPLLFTRYSACVYCPPANPEALHVLAGVQLQLLLLLPLLQPLLPPSEHACCAALQQALQECISQLLKSIPDVQNVCPLRHVLVQAGLPARIRDTSKLSGVQ